MKRYITIVFLLITIDLLILYERNRNYHENWKHYFVSAQCYGNNNGYAISHFFRFEKYPDFLWAQFILESYLRKYYPNDGNLSCSMMNFTEIEQYVYEENTKYNK